jgi:hypothetical protein
MALRATVCSTFEITVFKNFSLSGWMPLWEKGGVTMN